MTAPVEAVLGQLQERIFVAEFLGPTETSPKSITSWPLQRGQQDLALASRLLQLSLEEWH